MRGMWYNQRPSPIRHERSLTLLMCFVSVALLSLLAACGSISTHSQVAHSIPTPNVSATLSASATQTVQAEQHSPVTVQVVLVKQQGTLAAGNVTLTAQVSITNHTTKPIWIYIQQCPTPEILMTLTAEKAPPNRTIAFISLDNCILNGSSMVFDQNFGPGIAPGSTQRSMEDVTNLSHYATAWAPGTYILGAEITWHQGTIDQLDAPGSTLLSGSSQGQTIITLS